MTAITMAVISTMIGVSVSVVVPVVIRTLLYAPTGAA
jgi:hypothetical protein